MLVEHPRHGLAEVLEAEQDGFHLIQLRRVPQSDRALKMRALDNAERILRAEAEKPRRRPKASRERHGKMHRRTSGGGA
jgi:hypothetical protein